MPKTIPSDTPGTFKVPPAPDTSKPPTPGKGVEELIPLYGDTETSNEERSVSTVTAPTVDTGRSKEGKLQSETVVPHKPRGRPPKEIKEETKVTSTRSKEVLTPELVDDMRCYAPTISVSLQTPSLGTISFLVNEVITTSSSVVLVYDSRFPYGMRFAPAATTPDGTIIEYALKVKDQVFTAANSGITFSHKDFIYEIYLIRHQ